MERSEEHTSELQSHGLISYAVFCLKKKNRSRSTQPRDPPHNEHRTRHLSSSATGGVHASRRVDRLCLFFFNDTATTEIYTRPYTLSLHDALPIAVPRALTDCSMMPGHASSSA